MEELEDVKKELETKRQALAAELEAAKGKVNGIAGDLRRVDDALRALTRKKGRASRPKSSVRAAAEGSVRTLRSSSFFAEDKPLL